MTEPNRTSHQWVGARAVAWAIDESEVPANLLATLIVIARHADKDGRNAYHRIQRRAARDRRRARNRWNASRRPCDLELDALNAALGMMLAALVAFPVVILAYCWHVGIAIIP